MNRRKLLTGAAALGAFSGRVKEGWAQSTPITAPFNPNPLSLQMRAARPGQALRAQGYRNALGGLLSPTNLSAGTNTAQVRQLGGNSPVALAGLVVEYINWAANAGNATTAGTIPYGISAAVEWPLGTVRATFQFGSAHIGIVPAGGNLSSDFLPCYVPAGVTPWIRSFFTIAAGQTTALLQAGLLPLAALSEGVASGLNLTDFTTASSAFAGGLGSAPGFYALFGAPVSDVPGIGLLGDSLIRGRGEDATGTADGQNAIGNGGPYQRALESFTHGQVRNCRSGALARDWASAVVSPSANGALWRDTLRGCSTVIVQLGTNDLAANLTATTIWTYLMDIYVAAASVGCQVIPCTVPPRTTGTFTSLGGQATFVPSSNLGAFLPGGASDLGQLNALIRGTPSGISGGLPFVPAIIDGSDIVSTGRDSGFWKSSPAAWTADGTHWIGVAASGNNLNVGIPMVQAEVLRVLSQGGVVV